jgi:hypothetical protein
MGKMMVELGVLLVQRWITVRLHRFAHTIKLTGGSMRKNKKLDPTRIPEVKTDHQHNTSSRYSRSVECWLCWMC